MLPDIAQPFWGRLVNVLPAARCGAPPHHHCGSGLANEGWWGPVGRTQRSSKHTYVRTRRKAPSQSTLLLCISNECRPPSGRAAQAEPSGLRC